MALGRRPLLLLTLSLGLAGAQKSPEDVPVQPGFDARKVTVGLCLGHGPGCKCPMKVEGRWLTIQLAASRAHLVSPADPLRLALHSIWTRGQDVELVLFGIGEKLCQGLSAVVHPTGLRGQYRGPLEGGGSLLLHFVSTDYSHLILYVRFQDGGEATSLWALLARRHLEDPQWQGRYLEFVSKFQLQEAPVFNLDDPDAQCPPPGA